MWIKYIYIHIYAVRLGYFFSIHGNVLRKRTAYFLKNIFTLYTVTFQRFTGKKMFPKGWFGCHAEHVRFFRNTYICYRYV